MRKISEENQVVERFSPDLAKRRTEFRAAVDKDQDWRDEAREDYRFFYGKQWNESTAIKLKKEGRPVITDNRIKPLINLVSGYQRLNRYEAEFLPRTGDDEDLCVVRKGLTKYINDQCDYATQESLMALDGFICGRGWMGVSYDIDINTLDGEAKIKRISPFDVYVDPESREPDYSDARYICRARWANKDEIKSIYPEHADEIEAMTADWDEDEKVDRIGLEPLWYQKDTKKIRLVEEWRKEIVQQQYYVLMNGDMVISSDMSVEHIAIGIKEPVTLPKEKVIVTIFAGNVLLEEKDSPYEHGEFPFASYIVYYTGEEDDIPAGIIRDLKDLQRELNKRRSQSVAILNTQLNNGVIYEKGALDAANKHKLRNFGTVPGVTIETEMGGLEKIKFTNPAPPPAGEIQMLQETAQSIKDVSGINESMLGSDIPSGTSGRAIELRQKAAITHIGGIFDNLRRTKLQVMKLLWGANGKKGIVQQYYTEEKTFRILGEAGKPQYMTINKQVPAQDEQGNAIQDELGNTIYKTLNDMSVGEFDVVVSESPATATQRTAQFWALTDAVSKLGIPGDMVFDILIDLCDLPQKEEIKRRWQERQEAQQQAGGQVQEKVNATVNFKDLPPDGQQQFAAKNLGIQIQPQMQPMQAGANAGLQQQQPQGSMLEQVINSLPPQVLQQLAQLGQSNINRFAQAISYIEQQLPPQVRQQIALETQGAQPQQLLQAVYSMIMQALQGQRNIPAIQQSAVQNQSPTMTQAAMREVSGNMNPAL